MRPRAFLFPCCGRSAVETARQAGKGKRAFHLDSAGLSEAYLLYGRVMKIEKATENLSLKRAV